MVESVVIEKYDFEKMIEEAKKKHGESPAVQAPPGKNGNRKAGPSVGAAEDGEKSKSARKVDHKKAELLEKRKKYDPRAAIKN